MFTEDIYRDLKGKQQACNQRTITTTANNSVKQEARFMIFRCVQPWIIINTSKYAMFYENLYKFHRDMGRTLNKLPSVRTNRQTGYLS